MSFTNIDDHKAQSLPFFQQPEQVSFQAFDAPPVQLENLPKGLIEDQV
jgi:hypothetical protein